MINSTVLMSDALHFSAEQAINPYYFDSHTDTSIAQKEHDSIRAALMAAGVEVITTPSPTDSQDGVYTANWALVRGDKAVLARLPNVRKSEELYAKSVLESLGKEVIFAPEGLRFSGQGMRLLVVTIFFAEVATEVTKRPRNLQPTHLDIHAFSFRQFLSVTQQEIQS
ncbi:hypothetical protein KI440_00005 [Candidatus Saccharibacteria bacterium TM7i]|nr:hypothetical protein KI440_00005 [Candidatus Saccharibacteria bacterium TM7i]